MSRLFLPRLSARAVRSLSALAVAVFASCDARAQTAATASPQNLPSSEGTLRSLGVAPMPLFFPPNPPPLGRAIPRLVAPSAGRTPAPPALAAHVNEIFYPALGARLHTHSLKEPLRQQLDAYRTSKLALQNELRAEIMRLRNAEPAERIQALTTLARTQAPNLARLERDAENLRRDLMIGDYTWNTLREWRLADRERRAHSPVEIAQVMRAYAFYQAGLLPAQRRLLREISIELLLSADDPAKATAAQPHVFFPPEPARVLFPETIPPEAAARIALYQTRKSTLKKELYNAVYKHDGQLFGFLSGNTMSALVRKQAPRLAELETLAEEIRRLLPPAAISPRPLERSMLPVALTTRIEAMASAYAAAQKTAAEKIDAIVARAKSLPFQSNYRFDAEGLKFVLVPGRSARDPAVKAKIEAVRAEIGAIAEDYGRTLADLINERNAIRTEIGTTLGTGKADAIDAALSAALRIAHQKETENSYDEYRVAVFEPGLSPEQRRLLFDSVIERLDLPLPRGELQPTRLGNSW